MSPFRFHLSAFLYSMAIQKMCQHSLSFPFSKFPSVLCSQSLFLNTSETQFLLKSLVTTMLLNPMDIFQVILLDLKVVFEILDHSLILKTIFSLGFQETTFFFSSNHSGNFFLVLLLFLVSLTCKCWSILGLSVQTLLFILMS